MTLYSQYMYSLVLFTINNKYLFNSNKVSHIIKIYLIIIYIYLLSI
jgi:hypothetical protein